MLFLHFALQYDITDENRQYQSLVIWAFSRLLNFNFKEDNFHNLIFGLTKNRFFD